MFENPRRGRQARNFSTNVPKILDLKSSSEQIFFRKLSLGAPEYLESFFDLHQGWNFFEEKFLTIVMSLNDIDRGLDVCR